jgi:hypothetical protein
MALTDSPTWDVSLTFKDRDGNPSTISYHLDAALTFAEAGAAMAAVNATIVPLSDAVLVGVSLVLSQYENTYPATLPPESSDVERYVTFPFVGSVKNARTSIKIPSIKNTLIIDQTETLNMADALVIAFRDTFLDTGIGVGNSPVTIHGADLVALLDAPIKKHRGTVAG